MSYVRLPCEGYVTYVRQCESALRNSMAREQVTLESIKSMVNHESLLVVQPGNEAHVGQYLHH